MNAVATTTNYFVVLPSHNPSLPVVYTSNSDGAPRAHRDDIPAATSARIDLAINRVDEDNCTDCDSPIGYHFDGRTDPEVFVNHGFFVNTDGIARCENCVD